MHLKSSQTPSSRHSVRSLYFTQILAGFYNKTVLISYMHKSKGGSVIFTSHIILSSRVFRVNKGFKQNIKATPTMDLLLIHILWIYDHLFQLIHDKHFVETSNFN